MNTVDIMDTINQIDWVAQVDLGDTVETVDAVDTVEHTNIADTETVIGGIVEDQTNPEDVTDFSTNSLVLEANSADSAEELETQLPNTPVNGVASFNTDDSDTDFANLTDRLSQVESEQNDEFNSVNSSEVEDIDEDEEEEEEEDDEDVTSEDQVEESNATPLTLVDRFYALADANRTALKPALVAYDSNIEVADIYTWKEYADRVTRYKNYLLSNGLSNTAIHAFNSPEWFVAAIGSIAAGSHVAGIYNTNTDKQCLHVIRTGECDVLVIDTFDTLVKHYAQVFDDLIELQTRILIIDYTPITSDDLVSILDDEDTRHKLETLLDLQVRGFDLEINATTNSREAHLIEVTPDSTVTLIFTSGTTSDPKAVKITHRNIMASIDAVLTRIPLGSDPNFPEVVLSYLPLSHVAGQCLDIYAQIYHKGAVHFARPDALKGSLKKSLLAARPTIFLGVPRVWEKIREGLLAAGAKNYEGYSGAVLKSVAGAAKAVNLSYQKTVEDSKEYWGSYLASYVNYPAYYVSSSLTDKVKLALGLDRCKYFASGAAPITTEVLEYFMSLNMPIMEIYGMSETAGIISISDPFSAIDRYCGCPAPGVEVKIDSESSEIMVRGPNVFTGYHNYDGDMEGMFDEDNFFHTGDCGVIENNKLKITGRLKELIITAGGENVPPVLIENHIKSEAQTDSQMMLIGDQKKYLTILVFNPPNEPQLTEEQISNAIVQYNTHHKISKAQAVQKFRIIREELTVESGLLTPTMKMKRKRIADHYAGVIEEMYGSAN